jgi:hypothetical protein
MGQRKEIKGERNNFPLNLNGPSPQIMNLISFLPLTDVNRRTFIHKKLNLIFQVLIAANMKMTAF